MVDVQFAGMESTPLLFSGSFNDRSEGGHSAWSVRRGWGGKSSSMWRSLLWPQIG